MAERDPDIPKNRTRSGRLKGNRDADESEVESCDSSAVSTSERTKEEDFCQTAAARAAEFVSLREGDLRPWLLSAASLLATIEGSGEARGKTQTASEQRERRTGRH